MRVPRSLAVSFILIPTVAVLQGCEGGATSGEVRRDPEFEKAAMNAKYAMTEHLKPKKPKQSERNRSKRAASTK